jgi:hypothetical protein
MSEASPYASSKPCTTDPLKNPKNFSSHFHGPSTYKIALKWSLGCHIVEGLMQMREHEYRGNSIIRNRPILGP